MEERVSNGKAPVNNLVIREGNPWESKDSKYHGKTFYVTYEDLMVYLRQFVEEPKYLHLITFED